MIKRKGLIWLTAACLSLSVAGAAISLSNSDFSSQISYAETTTFDTAQTVSVTGATITAGADKSGSVTHKGLLVEPVEEKGSYSGTLNAILPADSTIGYTFPGSLHGDGSSMWIDFTFRFTSVKTQEWFEVYTVMINNNYWNSLIVRDMDGNTRTTWKWGGGWFETANDNGYVYPQYGGSNLTAGYLKTAYVDGVLSIDVLSAEKNVTLVKFDSNTYSSINNDAGVCGLEKIDFSEGYILSFSANSAGNEATAPLLIENINGQSFENATWEAEPSWYTSYASIPKITLSGEIAEGYTVEDPFIVPAATYTTLNDATEKSVAKIELQKDGGEWQSVSVGDIISEVGSYSIKYTAIEGGIALGNTLEKSFRIVGKGFDMRDVVSVSGATVTAGADKSGSVTHKGLLVEPAEEKGSYSGTLNAILPADSTIGYTFPGSLHGDGSSVWIDFTFRFTSVKTQEWFEVYTVMINNNYWSSMMVRDMEGHTRTTWKWGGGWYETARDDGYMYPQYGGSNLTAGYLKTAYVDGVLSIDVLSAEKNVTLVKFDSNTYSSINNDAGVCGLKKIDFSEGYILSFSANSAGNEATAPLLIESINGEALTGNTINNWNYLGYEYVEQDLAVYSDGTKIVDGSDLGVKFNYTATLGSLTFTGTKVVSPDLSGLDLLTDNTSKVTYSFNGYTVDRDVRVYVHYVYGASVSTKGDIAMNFYLALSDELINEADSYIEFTFSGATKKVALAEGVKKDNYYVFTYNVPAKDYNEDIALNLYVKGNLVDTVNYSVATYADNIISGDYSVEVKDLVASLIDYCECAEAYFAGATVDAKYTDITAETLSGYAGKAEGTVPEGVTVLGASLTLKSETSIRVYFADDKEVKSVVKVDGAEVEAVRVENNEVVYYYVEIANISAKDLDTEHTVEIGECKITYSALSYVYTNIESDNVALANVVKSMYVYNQKADAYEQSKLA